MGRIALLIVFFVVAYMKLVANQQPDNDLGNLMPKKGETTIYVVRHAEKDTGNPTDQDPGLTKAGEQRAEDLVLFLKDEPVEVFFATPYKRTQQTLAPILKGRPIQFYEAHAYAPLKERIVTEFIGKTILIVGHSNTILPMIEAFGGKKPLAEITDNQYDTIFKFKISSKGKVSPVQVKKFGSVSA